MVKITSNEDLDEGVDMLANMSQRVRPETANDPRGYKLTRFVSGFGPGANNQMLQNNSAVTGAFAKF